MSASNPTLGSFGELQLKIRKLDPRIIVLGILVFYLILGFTVLGFNRSPSQAVLTSFLAVSLEMLLGRLFKKEWVNPLSALVTSCSLSILLNYSHNFYVLVIPVFFAIGSKYFFTFNGRHNFNPAQIAVTLSLIFSGSLITAAPAYQWNGIESMAVFIVMFGVFFLLPKINRHWLVLSFLFWFTLTTFVRAMIMKHHLPFETLFLGTLSSPAFFIFTFFMITDPATSPKTKKGQLLAGMAIAFVDLGFHLKQSYFTFFFAASSVQLTILIYKHLDALRKEGGLARYFSSRFIKSGYYKRFTFLLLVLFLSTKAYSSYITPAFDSDDIDLSFERVDESVTGLLSEMGHVLERTDSRIQHMAKWLMSVGDSAASADVNNDGLQDLFLTFPLKKDEYRNGLYLNKGKFEFERVELPIKEKTQNVEENGVPSSAVFVDYDNDGDRDLFLTYAFGSPVFLQNKLIETGTLLFEDITKRVGLDKYTNSVAANFFDFNNDGLLDLIIGNVWPIFLPDYPPEERRYLNLFDLPKSEYEGDKRMFNFMHASWHQANNGGVNKLFVQGKKGVFEELDSKTIGLVETKWTLAIGTADFNLDGYIDLYVANDFGADDLYYNDQGRGFKNIKGTSFGAIGKDTYKGMNATIGDFDNNMLSDVYISNVHHPYQAEGSLLWMFYQAKDDEGVRQEESATKFGVLNESRFGWGAAAGDLNLDGHLDIVQANGMVDDSIDKKWDECPDYWYVNEKIARSAPSIHRYTSNWGDIRGYCIYGKERNRVYLNQGAVSYNKFVDVAKDVGVTEMTNSRGVALTDLNNDGKLDMVISHMFSSPTVYRNKLKGDQRWLGVELESLDRSCNRDAIGSRVVIQYQLGGKVQRQMRERVAVNGFNAQSDTRLLFGLPSGAEEIQLTVNWCLKKKTSYPIPDDQLNSYQRFSN